MANVSVFDIGGGKAFVAATDGIAAAAVEQAVPCRKDARLCLRVCNANASAAAVVRIKAGDGPRAVLGNREVTVSAGQTAYIRFLIPHGSRRWTQARWRYVWWMRTAMRWTRRHFWVSRSKRCRCKFKRGRAKSPALRVKMPIRRYKR